MKLRQRPFLFGRVIDTNAFGLTWGATLVYVYDAWSDDKARVPSLDRDRLLVPPAIINRLGWSRGFLETVDHRPLTAEDVLATHCFVTHIYSGGPRYFDEHH